MVACVREMLLFQCSSTTVEQVHASACWAAETLLLTEATVGVLGVPGVVDVDFPGICGLIMGMASISDIVHKTLMSWDIKNRTKSLVRMS